MTQISPSSFHVEDIVEFASTRPRTPLAKSFIAAALEGRRIAGRRGASKTWVQIESQCLGLASQCSVVQFGAKAARSVHSSTWRQVCDQLKSKLKGRTVTNYTRTIRLIMNGCGHARMAADFTNASLELAGLSRKGTKQPITDEHLATVLKRCQTKRKQHQREALPVLIELMRYVGLRVQEARMFYKSARPNLLRLETSTVVGVRDGTKGGRYRDVVLSSEAVPKVRELLHETIRIVDTHKTLWPGVSGKQAQRSLVEALRSVGLTGKFSPHSLRYRFAHEQTNRYQTQGFDEAVAIEHTAMDLGHGGTRRDLMLGTYYQKAHRTQFVNVRDEQQTIYAED